MAKAAKKGKSSEDTLDEGMLSLISGESFLILNAAMSNHES